jgi:outer membrane protein assembly factor BamB
LCGEAGRQCEKNTCHVKSKKHIVPAACYFLVIALHACAGSSSSPTPSPSPAPQQVVFNDYTTFGYDNQRNVFNPNSTAITPVSVPKVHLAWQSALGGGGDYNTQSQPILATKIPGHAGVLFVGGGAGNVYAYDALNGTLLWTRATGTELYVCPPGPPTWDIGVGGTVAYDPASKSLYVVGNTNASTDAYATNSLYHLDAATGQVLGQVNFAPSAASASELNFSHTAVTLNNGIAYVGTGSTCDISSWRGSVVAVNVPSMTIAKTFFTVWDPQNTRGAGAQPWSGGGVWGWGGVSLDSSGNVLTGVGNTDNAESGFGTILPPFVAAPQEYSGYGNTLLELAPDLSTVVANNHPIPLDTYSSVAFDLDVQGTPLVFSPNGSGCGTMVALQGKSGELSLYNEHAINNGPVAQYQLSPLTIAANDAYLGDPAYSPATGLVYAPVASSVTPSLFPPGLIAIDPGCGKPSVTWHAAFGSDASDAGISRAVPAASAGGVVFAGTVDGTGGDVWAVNASTGAVLNGGQPVLKTSGNLRVPPTIDGNWIFVLDYNGNMYGLTIDPSYPKIQSRHRAADARQSKWKSRRGFVRG